MGPGTRVLEPCVVDEADLAVQHLAENDFDHEADAGESDREVESCDDANRTSLDKKEVK